MDFGAYGSNGQYRSNITASYPPQYGPHYGYGPSNREIGVQMNFNQPHFSGPAPGFREITDSAQNTSIIQRTFI